MAMDESLLSWITFLPIAAGLALLANFVTWDGCP